MLHIICLLGSYLMNPESTCRETTNIQRVLYIPRHSQTDGTRLSTHLSITLQIQHICRFTSLGRMLDLQSTDQLFYCLIPSAMQPNGARSLGTNLRLSLIGPVHRLSALVGFDSIITTMKIAQPSDDPSIRNTTAGSLQEWECSKKAQI